GHPGLVVLGECGLDVRPVVAERLQGGVDLFLGLGVEPADPLLVEVLVLPRLLQAQRGEDVALQVAVDALDFDAHALGGPGGSGAREQDSGEEGQGERCGAAAAVAGQEDVLRVCAFGRGPSFASSSGSGALAPASSVGTRMAPSSGGA